MAEPTRKSRMIEGLAIQAIWQFGVFIASSGILSWGISYLVHTAHTLAVASHIFLVLLGLGGITWAAGIIPRRRKSYSKADVAEKIVIYPDQIGPMIYINQHREAIDGVYFTLMNFSAVDIELEPIDVQITGSSRTFGSARAEFNPSNVRKQGGRSQVSLNFYNLTQKDVQFIETVCERPGYFNLNFSGTLRFRTPVDSFNVPFGIVVRAGVQR
jgi:hypothetical protein